MSNLQTKRGRPKGSGIDDSATLNAMAEAIAKNTDLKPTTAIRKLGITDPSAIRRLRDKFNKNRAALMAQTIRKTNNSSTSRQKKDFTRPKPKKSTSRNRVTNQVAQVTKATVDSDMSQQFLKDQAATGIQFFTTIYKPWLALTASAMVTSARANLFLLSQPQAFANIGTIVARQTELTTWLMAMSFAPNYAYATMRRSGAKYCS